MLDKRLTYVDVQTALVMNAIVGLGLELEESEEVVNMCKGLEIMIAEREAAVESRMQGLLQEKEEALQENAKTLQEKEEALQAQKERIAELERLLAAKENSSISKEKNDMKLF